MDLVELETGIADSLSNAGDAQSDKDTSLIVSGRVVAVYVLPVLSCLSSAPVLNLTTKNPAQTILSKAIDVAGWYFPRTIVHLNTTGGAIANNYSQGVPVHDYLNAEIDQASNGDYYKVWILVE